MKVVARHIGLVSLVVVVGGLGCRRIVSAALGGDEKSGSACALITDAEIGTFVGSSSVTHDDGDEAHCTWTASDVNSTVNLSILSPTMAKLIPTMGEGEAVAGIGDSAMFYSGLASQMRVKKGSKELVFVAVIPSAMAGMTIKEGKTKKHAKTKGADGTESETSVTEETIENPAMKAIYEKMARAAVARM